MRSAKSLISGFGVAVSLIGAVACAFFITAALVAFHGSFSVSDDYPAQSTVLVASAKQDRAIVISVAPRAAVRQAVGNAPAVAARPQGVSTVVAPRTIVPNRPVKSDVTPAAAVAAPKVTPTASTPSATAPLANATAGLTNAVGTVVADATGSLGATVAPISPALGGTLHQLGTGLASGVVALGNTVAGLVTALGTHPAAPQG